MPKASIQLMAFVVVGIFLSPVESLTLSAMAQPVSPTPAKSGDAAAAEDVFKSKGLTKVGFWLESAQEVEFRTTANGVRGLKAKILTETQARTSTARAIQTATGIYANLNAELVRLDDQMSKLKKNNPAQYNQLVEPYNTTLQQQKLRKAEIEELKKKQGNIEDSQTLYSDAALAAVQKADAVLADYAHLASDAALGAAIKQFNATAPQALKLGPSTGFTGDAAFVKKCVSDMAAAAIPVKMENGVPFVEVIVNGKKYTMLWDSGASSVSLNFKTAEAWGLHATAADKTVSVQIADGSTVQCKVVTAPSIRVGVFTAENVECLIHPASAKNSPDLLGGAFQSHFLCRLDQQAGVLHLTPIDKSVSVDKPVEIAALPGSPPGAPPTAPSNIFDDGWNPPKRADNPPPPLRTADPPVAPPKVEPPDDHGTRPPDPVRPAAPPKTLRAFPEDADLAKSRQLLKEVFAKQLADSSMPGRSKLARALLDEVPKIPDNPVDQYALMVGGLNAAKEAGSLPLCFEAVDVLSRTYAVDALRAKTDAALSVVLKSDSPGAANANVRAALPLVEELINAEDFASASKLCELLRPIITAQPDLAAQVNKRMNDIRDVSAAVAKLRVAPADPAANLAMGRYFCFVADRWDKGLPLLAKGSDPELKGLAQNELSNPTSLDALGQLGDGWWTVAAKQPEADRPKLMQHAAAIYRSALAMEGVTGLRRALMEKRIAEVPRLSAPTRPGGAGATAFTNSLGMKFALIPAGEFTMGSPLNEPHHHDDETEHKVQITRAFELGTHHVTRGQFAAFVKASGYKTEAEVASAGGRTWKSVGFEQNDNHPVVIVSWNDAAAFCQWLSKQEGKKYRLPTEAEYEYACRAGTATAYPWGNDPEDGKGWCNAADLAYNAKNPRTGTFNWSDGFVDTSPVGSFRPNAFGLYDMIGNAWEWCGDYYAPYPAGAAIDPTGPAQGDKTASRVVRGGSWSALPDYCRAAARRALAANFRQNFLGFRCALDIQ